MLKPENDIGNIEYKLKIIPQTKHRLQQLITQLKWRLKQGNGKAYYYIGVYDDGNIANIKLDIFKESLHNLKSMCKEINASIRKVILKNNWWNIEIRKNIEKNINYKILFIGPSQVGKTTLISNLVNDMTDNGNGKSRQMIFNHKHEIFKGLTSSISINKLKIKNKIYHLIDTPGYKKYFKTTVSALSKYKPDQVFLCFEASKTNEIEFYLNLVKYYEYKYNIIFINSNIDDIKYIKKKFNLNNFFIIDNIKGSYSKLLKFMNKIKIINKSKLLFEACKVLTIPNFGSVLVGINNKNIEINKKYYLSNSEFLNKEVIIDSIYYLNKSLDKIVKNKLITIKVDGNKSNIILTEEQIESNDKILVTCERSIPYNTGICIYNNQYIVIKINKIKDYYELSSNSLIINLSNKIIIKANNEFFYCLKYNPHVLYQ